MYDILEFEYMVSIYGMLYLALGTGLYFRRSQRLIRGIQVFLIANVVFEFAFQLAPFISDPLWELLVLYTVLMGFGLYLTTDLSVLARISTGDARINEAPPDDRGRAEGETTREPAAVNGGSTGVARSTDDPQTEIAKSVDEPPIDSGSAETVSELVEKGDTLQETAADYHGDDAYDEAIETYDEARAAYEDALESASGNNIFDADAIASKLDAVEEEQRDTRRQRLQRDVTAIAETLDSVEGEDDDRGVSGARKTLEDLESEVAAARETATENEFEELRDEIETLEQRRQGRLDALSDRSQQVPKDIPRPPDITVDYEKLTDEEPIGGGGNADVSRATLPTPDGDVTLAIKRPRMSGTLHTDAVERMLDEAETWDKLDDHDHIVGVVDYGSEPMPWIAMEYMNGGHLGQREREMELPEALWTAIAVTKGVRHAHRRGVAHLDLKPQNILFATVDGAWDVPKVADWGLSKHLLDHSKSVEGMSVEYAAPEQFDEEFGAVDDITDVYQLGAVFYELFTGRPPFEGKPFKVLDKVKTVQPTPPSEIADVPEKIDDILLKSLSKKRSDRYESVLLLRNELQALYDEL